MTIEGEYAPSPWEWVRNQVDEYERSGGAAANTLPNTEWEIVLVFTRARRRASCARRR